MKITFTNTVGIPEEYSPKPATASVPEWYKELPSYMGGEKTYWCYLHSTKLRLLRFRRQNI